MFHFIFTTFWFIRRDRSTVFGVIILMMNYWYAWACWEKQANTESDRKLLNYAAHFTLFSVRWLECVNQIRFYGLFVSWKQAQHPPRKYRQGNSSKARGIFIFLQKHFYNAMRRYHFVNLLCNLSLILTELYYFEEKGKRGNFYGTWTLMESKGSDDMM